jgi:hypothetical protein
MLKLNTNINFILFLVDFWKRGEYELRVPKFTLCFFECTLLYSAYYQKLKMGNTVPDHKSWSQNPASPFHQPFHCHWCHSVLKLRTLYFQKRVLAMRANTVMLWTKILYMTIGPTERLCYHNMATLRNTRIHLDLLWKAVWTQSTLCRRNRKSQFD